MYAAVQAALQPRTAFLAGAVVRQVIHARGRRVAMSEPHNRADNGPDWSAAIASIAQRGDREAFTRLFGHFAPRIKAFLCRSGEPEGVAEELAQEAMIAVWRKAALFDPASAGAAAWIFTIARNLRIDAQRRQRRAGTRADLDEVTAEFEIDNAPGPELHLSQAQGAERIRRAVTALTQEQQRVVELSFFRDKAHVEIAGILGIPLGTVKSRLRLAMRRLRQRLDDLS